MYLYCKIRNTKIIPISYKGAVLLLCYIILLIVYQVKSCYICAQDVVRKKIKIARNTMNGFQLNSATIAAISYYAADRFEISI
jgi:hypothetical protein